MRCMAPETEQRCRDAATSQRTTDLEAKPRHGSCVIRLHLLGFLSWSSQRLDTATRRTINRYKTLQDYSRLFNSLSASKTLVGLSFLMPLLSMYAELNHATTTTTAIKILQTPCCFFIDTWCLLWDRTYAISEETGDQVCYLWSSQPVPTTFSATLPRSSLEEDQVQVCYLLVVIKFKSVIRSAKKKKILDINPESGGLSTFCERVNDSVVKRPSTSIGPGACCCLGSKLPRLTGDRRGRQLPWNSRTSSSPTSTCMLGHQLSRRSSAQFEVQVQGARSRCPRGSVQQVQVSLAAALQCR